ncbi:MAG: hypothetical protein K2N56_03635 [Oscillospiraceae bacterium]|nr:hypothetical protein [Oscillospiraceae bacterium]
MKIKKAIASVIAAVFCLTMITGTASAHPTEINAGKFTNSSKLDILIRIHPTAITSSLLTYNDVYKYGTDWNGISSNVKINIREDTTGMPTIASEGLVCGEDLGEGYFGKTSYYRANGTQVYGFMDYDYVIISINSDPNAFDGARDKKEAARKTYLHEIGHALKLTHPITLNYDDHIYNGLPYAVMNQKKPIVDGEWISPTITPHDKQCLIEKWGA